MSILMSHSGWCVLGKGGGHFAKLCLFSEGERRHKPAKISFYYGKPGVSGVRPLNKSSFGADFCFSSILRNISGLPEAADAAP